MYIPKYFKRNWIWWGSDLCLFFWENCCSKCCHLFIGEEKTIFVSLVHLIILLKNGQIKCRNTLT